MKSPLYIVVFLCMTYMSVAQITFHRTYGTLGQNLASNVQQTSDGGFIVAGDGFGLLFNGGHLLVKTDPDGDTLWTRLINSNYNDHTSKMEVTDDGGYIICGTSSAILPSNSDISLVKTDANGNVSWNKRYHLAVPSTNQGNSVCKTYDGGYLITGQLTLNGMTDISVIKTDDSGNIEWSKIMGGPGIDKGVSVIQSSDSGYVITGITESFGNGSRVFLSKLNQTGNTLWFKTYYENSVPGLQGFGNDVQQTPDGGYILLVNRDSLGLHDILLLRADGAGTLLWSKVYSGSYKSIANGMCQTADGGYAIAFSKVSPALNSDISVIRTDSSGNVAWCKVYGDTTDDQASDISPTADGGFIIAGRKYFQNPGDFDMYLIKTDAAGNSGCFESPFSPDVHAPITIETLESSIDTTGFIMTTFPSAFESGARFNTLCVNTGIAENGNDFPYLIYPNPASGKFNIRSDLNELTVINHLGEIVYNKHGELNHAEIDLSSQSRGIYLCKLSGDGKMYVLKLILQ